MLTATIDQEIEKVSRSGRHTCSSTERNLQELVNRTVSTNVFTKQEGRHYKHFVNFKRDRLANLDFSSVFKWISDRKKSVQLGIRAW